MQEPPVPAFTGGSCYDGRFHQDTDSMTMLDGMRRHKGWLKWSLALVVLTFVVFFIPNFTSTGASSNEVLAKVEGQEITVRQFQQRYSAQLQAYRNAYGAQVNEQLLRQLGIEQQIVQQLVDEES